MHARKLHYSIITGCLYSVGWWSALLSDIFHERQRFRGVLLHLHSACEQDVERDESNVPWLHQGNEANQFSTWLSLVCLSCSRELSSSLMVAVVIGLIRFYPWGWEVCSIRCCATIFITYAVITIAIRLRSDYDISHAPASNSMQAKNEHVSFRHSRITVESNVSWYRCIVVVSQLWYRL